MAKRFGTKLTLTVEYPESMGPDTMFQSGCKMWDPNIEQMFDMFEGLLLAHGFHQDVIDNHICSLAAELEAGTDGIDFLEDIEGNVCDCDGPLCDHLFDLSGGR